ncbi:MAG TPA: hypothetical protein VGV67_05980 [Solirubrobacteraceae bacterium]|nr:hypothetical protein [Solirubrobacteraceae bacterium]
MVAGLVGAALAGAAGAQEGGSGGFVGTFVVAGDRVAGRLHPPPPPRARPSNIATRARFADLRDAVPYRDGFLVADAGTHRVYRVSGSGRMRRFAPRARLRAPDGLALTTRGDVLIADAHAHAVRRVTPNGTIVTVAGCGRAGRSGDGGPARRACLREPGDVAPLPRGGMLIADAGNHRVRRVSPGGRMSTAAGTVRGYAGDGGRAMRARLRFPRGVAPLAGGGFAIADSGNARIRLVGRDGRIRSAPRPQPPLRLSVPVDVEAAGDGTVLVADPDAPSVLRMHPDGTWSPLAGSAPDRALAGSAGPVQPIAVAADRRGLLVVDAVGDVVWLVSTSMTRLLAVHVAAARETDPGEPLRVTIRSTREAVVDLRVVREHTVATQTLRVGPGATEAEVLDTTTRGDYRIDAVARAGSRIATARLTVVVAENRVVEPVGAEAVDRALGLESRGIAPLASRSSRFTRERSQVRNPSPWRPRHCCAEMRLPPPGESGSRPTGAT